MYKCVICDFNTKSKINYEVHTKTKKHLKRLPENMPTLPEMTLPENMPTLPEIIMPNTILPENITLIIEEEQEQENKTFEYYQKYLTLYNELDMFRKNNREAIHKGTSDWIQLMRVLNIQFKECYKDYDLKRTHWKPIKSQVLLSMIHHMREKRELKWQKNNQHILIDYYYAKWNRRMTYLCVDIRDWRVSPQM